MTVLSSTSLSVDTAKVRWLEPYVSAGLNQKTIGLQPKGVFTGFNAVPFNSGPLFGVTLQVDPVLGISGANILETTGGKYCVTLIQTTNVNIDLSAFFSQTVYVALDAQYSVGTTTASQIKVVDAAELTTNLDLVPLAKVNVPGVGPISASAINTGYRLLSGDSITPESRPTQNLLPNGAFERDVGGSPPVGWSSSGVPLVLTVDGGVSRSGTKSLRLDAVAPVSLFALSQPMVAFPGVSYRVGGWMRSVAGPSQITGGNGVRLQVSWFDATDTLLSTSNIDDNPGAPLGFTGPGISFVERVAEVTAPANTVTARFRIFFDSCSGTLYFDDGFFATREWDVSADAGIGYAGGPNWADGTTNPATSVEAQLDKIVADLAANSGAPKIGSTAAPAWADGTLNPATSVQGQLNKIISDLAGASGAPKVGNAPSKILANTFTALNTFGQGLNVSDTKTLLLGDLAKLRFNSVNSSIVEWGDGVGGTLWHLDSTSGLWNLNYGTGGGARFPFSFQFSDGGNSSILLENTNGVTAVDGWARALGIQQRFLVGTLSNHPLDLETNNTARWRVAATGELQGQGGGNYIQNVFWPALDTDADIKRAREFWMRSAPPKNFIINGDMSIWQRGVGPLTLDSSPRFLADRWQAYLASGSGGTTYSQVDFFGQGNYWAVLARNVGDTSLVTRSLVYEIERDPVQGIFGTSTVQQLVDANRNQGLPLTLQFSVAIGSAMSGTLVAKLVAGRGSLGSLPYRQGYTSPHIECTQSFTVSSFSGTYVLTVPGFHFLSNTNRLAVVFEWTPATNPAVANDQFGVKGVQLCLGLPADNLNGFLPNPNYAEGSFANELAACQRFYEHSYDYGTYPDTVTDQGRFQSAVLGVATVPGVEFSATHPKFRVAKRSTPQVSLYSVLGSAGAGGGSRWVVGANSTVFVQPLWAATGGFEVSYGGQVGGVPTNPYTPATPFRMYGHWIADAEDI